MLHAQKEPADDGLVGSKHVQENDDRVTVPGVKLL